MSSTSNKILDTLIQAEQLIHNPKSWIKGGYIGIKDKTSHKANSDPLPTTIYKATADIDSGYRKPEDFCYCSVGAIRMAAVLNKTDPQVVAEIVKQHLPNGIFTIPTFNDSSTTTHRQVVEVFNAAIAEQRTKAK